MRALRVLQKIQDLLNAKNLSQRAGIARATTGP